MSQPSQQPSSPRPLRIVQNASQFAQALAQLQAANIWALDVCSAGPNPLSDAVQLLFVATEHTTYAIHTPSAGNLKAIIPLLQNERRLKVLHQGKRVLSFLAQLLAHTEPLGLLCPTIFDTYIASQLLSASSADHDLVSLAARHLDLHLPAPLPNVAQGNLPQAEVETRARYVSSLLPLRQVLRQRLIEGELVSVAKIEFDLVPVIADMERTGIYLNLHAWEQTWEPIRQQRVRLADQLSNSLGSHMQQSLFGTAVFNPDSPQQTLEALQRLGLKITHTNEGLLKQYANAYPEVRDLLAYRAVAKAITSCGDLFPQHVDPKTHRIHASYEQIGARTGRMSCSDPNVQQVPRQKEVRACFQAEPESVLVVADYSQVELRIAAAMANDARMIEAYQDRQDLHRLTASLISGTPFDQVQPHERNAAKAVNFGLLFAMGAPGLARYAQNEYGVALTLEQAEAFRQRFFTAYTGIRRWHDQAKHALRAAERGEQVILRSVAGRRFEYRGQAGLALFLNSPVQGSAADLMKAAMVRVHRSLAQKTKARIIGVVHDELLVESPLSEAEATALIVRGEMESAGNEFFPNVPFVADAQVVASWGDA